VIGKETGKMRSVRLRAMITLGFSFVLILGFAKIALAMGKGPEVPG